MGSRPSSPAKPAAAASATSSDAFSLRERDEGSVEGNRCAEERGSALLPSQVKIQREELERQHRLMQLVNYRFSHDAIKQSTASSNPSFFAQTTALAAAARADDKASNAVVVAVALPEMVRPPVHTASASSLHASAGFSRSVSLCQTSVTDNPACGTPRTSTADQTAAAISCDPCPSTPSVLQQTPRRSFEDHRPSGSVGAVPVESEKPGHHHGRRPHMTPLSPSLSAHQPSSGNGTPQSTPRTRHRGRTPSSVRYGSSLVEVEFFQLTRNAAQPASVSPQQRLSTPRFSATDATVLE